MVARGGLFQWCRGCEGARSDGARDGVIRKGKGRAISRRNY